MIIMKIHMFSGEKNMACVTDNVRNDIVDIQRRLERETTMQTAWIILLPPPQAVQPVMSMPVRRLKFII